MFAEQPHIGPDPTSVDLTSDLTTFVGANGIEAGLDVGLVTKGEASVTVKFARPKADEAE